MTTHRGLLLCSAGLAVTLLGGCTQARANQPSTAPTPTQAASFAVETTRGPVSLAGGLIDLQAAVEASVKQVGPAVVSIRTDLGLGSGFIYSTSGLVLTNNHVITGAATILVGLSDGRHFPGKVLGGNAGFGVAVVKIEGSDLPVARLGDSGVLQVGQFVLAIGNPYGFDHTVTIGVVSALKRPVSEGVGSYNQPMIQTDAAINPGNSGGPLVNLAGEVIGINTLIATPDGTPAQGLGFAVPIATAARLAPQLAQTGKIANSGQPYLGVSLSDITLQSSGSSPLDILGGQRSPRRGAPPAGTDHGVVISQLSADGAAAKAGLQVNDVIVSFANREVYTTDELLQELVLHAPGDRVDAIIVRNGQRSTIMITIGEAPLQ